jgi:NADH-quinone oxidoreductase subunit H
MRSIAQLISYEVSIGILIMSILITGTGSLNINKIMYNQIYVSNMFALFPIMILFFISALAETNRPPFDLPEAESELIAGYILEYGGFLFAAIYLAEYAFILFMCSFISILFFGNISILFTLLLIFTFV